jgi:hypothetical protein
MLQNWDRPSPLLSPAFQVPMTDISTSDHSAMNAFSTMPGARESVMRLTASTLMSLPYPLLFAPGSPMLPPPLSVSARSSLTF